MDLWYNGISVREWKTLTHQQRRGFLRYVVGHLGDAKHESLIRALGESIAEDELNGDHFSPTLATSG